MAADEAPRIFVSGACDHCSEWFLLVTDEEIGRTTGWTGSGALYCSPAHKRAAAKKRAKSRPRMCPVEFCENEIRLAHAVVCGSCWSVAASMCLGKRRLTEAVAMDIEHRRGRAGYWCRCCGWWHNTSNPADDPGSLIERVGRVLVGMASIRGQLWVNDLIESWDPEVKDRQAWMDRRAAGRKNQAEA
jgi:hypothetical protein